jgi:prohibitin 1
MPKQKPPTTEAPPEPTWFDRHHFKLTLSFLSLLFVLFFFWNSIFFSIYPGEAGVLWRRFWGGTVLTRYFPEGFYAIMPFNRLYVYDVRLQAQNDDVVFLTRNGLLLSVKWATVFQPRRDALARLHVDLGPNYKETFMRPKTLHALRAVLGNYTHEEIYARDEDGLLDEIYDRLVGEVGTYIFLERVMVTELLLPEKIQEAIDDKLTQEQIALSYPYRIAREYQEKQRKIIEAEGIAQFESISGIPILQWRGIEATVELAQSQNAKIIVIGTSANGLPIILNTGDGSVTTGGGGGGQ